MLTTKSGTRTKKKTSIVEEGVSVTPIPLTAGETLTINYDGLLAQHGADSVYAHIGYGSNDHWVEIEDVPMKSKKKLWTCDVTPRDSRVNFCFHDGANNWDNNNGHNWSLTVHDGGLQ